MLRKHLLLLNVPMAVFVLLAPLANAQSPDRIGSQLREAYNAKVLFLRGFYAGDALTYGSDGTLTPAQDKGDWTVDGIVRVTNLTVAKDKVTIDAERAGVGWTLPGFGPIFEPASSDPRIVPRIVHIEIRVGSELKDLPEARALLSKIFLGTEDSLADTAPDYWTPCLQSGSSGKFSQLYYRCRLSPDLLAIPGFKSRANSAASGEIGAAKASVTGPVYAVTKEVVPPHVEISPDPEYTVAARREKYSGMAFVAFVVDMNGKVQDLRIVSPLGYGLDDKAVDAVRKWKFTPATKGGEPVAVQIEVKVEFKLY